MTCETLTFSGKGDVHIGIYGGKLIKAGNVGPLTIAISASDNPLLDYTSPGGGMVDVLSRIESVVGTGMFYNFSQENLAIALRGVGTNVPSTSVVSEVKVATALDSLIVLDHLPSTPTIVVEDITDTTTYALGTDYTVDRVGFTPLSTGSIAVDEVLHITYTSIAYDNLEALTAGNLAYTIVISGINEANEDSPVLIKLHKVKFAPVADLGLITDEFSGLEMTFNVLCDGSIIEAGKSKFFTMNKA